MENAFGPPVFLAFVYPGNLSKGGFCHRFKEVRIGAVWDGLILSGKLKYIQACVCVCVCVWLLYEAFCHVLDLPFQMLSPETARISGLR